MGFHDVVYPLKVQYGSQFTMGFSNAQTQVDSGARYVNRNWEDPIRVFDLRSGLNKPETANKYREFYYNRGGSENVWKLEDPTDFTTNASDATKPRRTPPTDADVSYGPIADPAIEQFQSFQLVSRYQDESGTYVYDRPITKPKENSVVASLLDVVTPISVPQGAIVVDYLTGQVTIDFSLVPGAVAGAVLRMGCEFYVPVRFGEETDQAAGGEWARFNDERLPTSAVEEREDTYLDSLAQRGGADNHLDATANFVLSPSIRVHTIEPGVTHNPILPDVSDLSELGEYFAIVNRSGSTRLLYANASGAVAGAINNGQTARVWLFEDLNGAKTWALIAI